jgi:ribosomal protein S19
MFPILPEFIVGNLYEGLKVLVVLINEDSVGCKF